VKRSVCFRNNGRSDPRDYSSSRPLTRNVTRRRQTREVNDPTACTTETPMQEDATYSVARSQKRPVETIRFSVKRAANAVAVNMPSRVQLTDILWACPRLANAVKKRIQPEKHCRSQEMKCFHADSARRIRVSRKAAPRCTRNPAGASYRCHGRVEAWAAEEL
jgi:hypothetical protein